MTPLAVSICAHTHNPGRCFSLHKFRLCTILKLRNNIPESIEQVIVRHDIRDVCILPLDNFEIELLRSTKIVISPKYDDAAGLCDLNSHAFRKFSATLLVDFLFPVSAPLVQVKDVLLNLHYRSIEQKGGEIAPEVCSECERSAGRFLVLTGHTPWCPKL